MSSEDDDDEELLQRALAQQAQRDENLKRAAGVPPPTSGLSGLPPPQRLAPSPAAVPSRTAPPGATAGSGPPRRTPPRTPPNRAPPPAPPATTMDDDEEESDVELLSISSDDDTPPPARRDPVQHRDGGSNWPEGGRGEDDSDLEWDEDGHEPQNWTNVDQAELVRRVREMREARTARTAPTVRLRRTATIVDAPRGEELLDPLGLGLINVKSLALVRDKRDAYQNGKAGSNEFESGEEETAPVRDSSLREKVMYHSENFDPKVFLARIHKNTGASDLEAGEGALKTDLQLCKEQLKKLVKENFDCFISCKNTIDDIHSKLQQIEADPEGAGTVHLSNSIQSVDVVAKRAFGPLLERQAQAERIRSVQGMLQRFRTLFNLPSIIRGNISKGEFDLAIRDYKKAKSLVQYTHVGILSRVLEEVDKIVQEFKDTLYKTMENPNVENSQLEITIRLLLELEPDSDPVWYYLTIQDRRIRGLLEGCSLEHEARMDALQGRVQERVQSDARWKQLQRESNKASDVDFNILLGEQDKEVGDGHLKESTGEESDALLGRLIRRLTVIFVQHVPSFWRLALLIFSGKFVKVSQPGSVNGRPSGTLSNDAAMYPFENQLDLQHSKHSMDEVVTMVHTIISLYETKVLNAFNTLAESKVLRPFMREALIEITKASVALQGKDCAPKSAVQALLVLRLDVTRIFVLRLCTLIRGVSSEFAQEEDWIPVPTSERGGTPYAISYLPLRFRNMLVAAMENMTEMIQRISSEAVELLEEQAASVYEMRAHVRSTFVECFLDFAECLDNLSEGIPLEDSTVGESSIVEEEFMGLIPGSEVSNPHQRLLIVLSNVAFCKSSLLPALLQSYEPLWNYASSESRMIEANHSSTIEQADAAFNSLEKKILDRYNFAKATRVGVAAAAYLVNDGTQWGQTHPIKGIRDNLIELLHPLVTVHAEVHSGAEPFLDRVIKALVEALIVALLNVFTENKHKFLRLLDVNGYCQLTLELDFLDAVLERYFTGAAREAAVGLRDMLLEKVCESVRELHQAELAGPTSMRASRGGSEEALNLDRTGPMSPEEIQAIAHQISAEYLPTEFRRARTNIVCFTEMNTGGKRTANLPKSNSGRHLLPSGGSIFHHIRKSPSIFGGEPPLSPRADYAGSDIGSENSSRGGFTSDRYSRFQFDSRNERRGSHHSLSSRSYDTDLL
ncbi:unnamed protein product [Calypogeia fissa]